MDIILLKDVKPLGNAGDIISVKPGYARNYLFPRSLALRSSKRNRAIADEKKQNAAKRTAHQDKVNMALADKLHNLEITFEVEVGAEEKMFGAITSHDIHKKLQEKKIEIDRFSIELPDPIKALGIYHIPIKISKDKKPELKIYVIKT